MQREISSHRNSLVLVLVFCFLFLLLAVLESLQIRMSGEINEYEVFGLIYRAQEPLNVKELHLTEAFRHILQNLSLRKLLLIRILYFLQCLLCRCKEQTRQEIEFAAKHSTRENPL